MFIEVRTSSSTFPPPQETSWVGTLGSGIAGGGALGGGIAIPESRLRNGMLLLAVKLGCALVAAATTAPPLVDCGTAIGKREALSLK